MTNPFPTPEELAAQAREALRKHPPKTGHEYFVHLVRRGFINAEGQVTRLIGGAAEPEPNYKTWTGEESTDRQPEKKAKKPKTKS